MNTNLTPKEQIIFNRIASGGTRKACKKFIENLYDGNGVEHHEFTDIFASLRGKGLIDATRWRSGWPEGHVFATDEAMCHFFNRKQSPGQKKWIRIAGNYFGDEMARSFLAKAVILDDYNDIDIDAMCKCILELQKDKDITAICNMEIREISARYFQSSAKILDAIKPFLIQLGLPQTMFEQRPQILLADSPKEPLSFTMVENQASFLRAVKCCPEHAWCCTYGFRFSNLTRNSLDKVKLFSRSNLTMKNLADLLGNHNFFYWGDLDPAGMQIFESIWTNFPEVRLSPLYKPMLERLESGAPEMNHPYATITGKAGQKMTTNLKHPKAKQLAEICASLKRGVDQECLTDDEILACMATICGDG